MSLIEKSEIEELRDRRVNLLREVSQGEGLSPNEPEKTERLREAFGGYDEDLLDQFLEAAFDALGESPFASALRNALTYREGMNLKDRREAFVKEKGGSARNLMRYEVEGANLLVRQFEVIEDLYKRQQQFQDDEEDARDIDIRVLQERVSALEERLAHVIHFLAELSTGAEFQDKFGSPSGFNEIVEAAQGLSKLSK